MKRLTVVLILAIIATVCSWFVFYMLWSAWNQSFDKEFSRIQTQQETNKRLENIEYELKQLREKNDELHKPVIKKK